MTFGEMFAWWRDFYAVPHKVRTWAEYQRMFDRHLKKWANRPGSTITKQDVQAVHRIIGADRKHHANRVVQLIRAVYNRAINDAGWEGRNPATGVKMFDEEPRARFLQDDEIRRFFKAVEKQNQDFQDAVWLAVLTGARRSNLFGMRWDQIQGDIWRVPSTTTKSKKPIEIPLVAKALEILLRRRGEANGSPWVFPSAGTASGHIDRPGKPWDAVRKQSELEDLRWHDLRRSLGSWATMTGSNLPTVGKMLGHGAGSSATAVYARLDNHTVKQAVERATEAILERATPKRRAK
jgi:integrase